MLRFCACIALLQCVFLYCLLRRGRRLERDALRERLALPSLSDASWPSAALIVPVGAVGESTSAALTSLLAQDYPRYVPVFVTASAEEAAAGLVRGLQKSFPALRHVVAGRATLCGQKNHNLLRGIASVESDDVQVYAFCDSTHSARPDFLRCLLAPLARGEAEYSTGYHQVLARDGGMPTIGYAMNVLLMRLLQALAVFTQPWGGAMSLRREAFRRHNIAELWRHTVVDDCSLAGLLLRKRQKVALCASALLRTEARAQKWSVWRAWLERQILFLKFCIRGQWLLLGFALPLMIVPPVWAFCVLLGGLLNFGSVAALFPALAWLGFSCWLAGAFRSLAGSSASLARWAGGLVLSIALLALVYLHTLGSREILWQNIRYRVGRGGRILGMVLSS